MGLINNSTSTAPDRTGGGRGEGARVHMVWLSSVALASRAFTALSCFVTFSLRSAIAIDHANIRTPTQNVPFLAWNA